MERVTLATKAFINGIKDAIQLEEITDEQILSINYLKEQNCYYHVELETESEELGRTFNNNFFFRFEKDKDYFLREFYKLAQKDEFHDKEEEFGLLMGFPPAACKEWALQREKDDCCDNICVWYGGMGFASYPSTMKEDIQWLLENKPLKNGDFVRISFKEHVVKDGWEKELYEDIARYI